MIFWRLITSLQGLALALTPVSALAQDHLEPAKSDSYRKLLTDVFHEGRGANSVAQAIIIPSFAREISVSIHRNGDHFELLVMEPSAHLWNYELAEMVGNGSIEYLGDTPEQAASRRTREVETLTRGLPDDPRDVGLNRCVSRLNNRNANAILAAWTSMLAEVKEPTTSSGDEIEIVTDGTSYVFWSHSDENNREGEVHAPRAGKTADFANLADTLVQYCHHEASGRDIRRIAGAIRVAED